ncbi:MAG TPA: hypothetical protein VGK59_15940 [Ohtaekwangia sp.]
MKSFVSIIIFYFLLLFVSAAVAQEAPRNKVIITGVRFAYPLVEKWIQDYKTVNPSTEIIIESRTVNDPDKYDLLIEAYEQDPTVKETRDYLNFGRYALLPVANASSAFALTYQKKGLTKNQIKLLYFHDILSEKNEDDQITIPVTVYTRLQKAGAPTTFARYYGYEQQNIKGKAIGGADEHLIKAVLKDSSGISFASLSLVYDRQSRGIVPGLAVIPADLDDNNRVSESEKDYASLDHVIQLLEEKERKNIPVEYLHLSIGKLNTNTDALKFLLWVIDNGQADLNTFGFLKPELKRFESDKEKFEQRASRK